MNKKDRLIAGTIGPRCSILKDKNVDNKIIIFFSGYIKNQDNQGKLEMFFVFEFQSFMEIQDYDNKFKRNHSSNYFSEVYLEMLGLYIIRYNALKALYQ